LEFEGIKGKKQRAGRKAKEAGKLGGQEAMKLEDCEAG
jgi:hypothetical protein